MNTFSAHAEEHRSSAGGGQDSHRTRRIWWLYIGGCGFLHGRGSRGIELEDDGEFAIGLKGEATAAQAKATAGFDFLSYSSDNDGSTFGEKEKKHLFGASASAKAGAGVSAGVWLESETAIEGNFVNVNAPSFSLDLSLIVASVDVTVPTLSFKWPW